MHDDTPDSHIDLLRLYRVSLAEWYILNSVGYGIRSVENLAWVTHDESMTFSTGPVSLQEAEEGLSSCLSKGWLRVITEDMLREIALGMSESGLIGPVYGFPLIGEVDFSLQGAELHERIYQAYNGADWGINAMYPRSVDGVEENYCRTLEGAMAFAEDCKRFGKDVLQVNSPIPIGPWCVYWWKRYLSGYRVDVIYRRSDWESEDASRK